MYIYRFKKEFECMSKLIYPRQNLGTDQRIAEKLIFESFKNLFYDVTIGFILNCT